ncbi:hypothetical protein GGS23DRAFT_386727 [Durotheca rogersii]|uniref:uncharacterized protein n=1 Tax=Durotheca rogersii TaxID=419775 RepID=UPI0022203F5F|nr:uncharacterized protein GGS23DRAFT_386727 [Durotheca rogersii]KAI5857312.1 hypothetical protein GGS23DRAFT_386727 [Durotheca rogersii]
MVRNSAWLQRASAGSAGPAKLAESQLEDGKLEGAADAARGDPALGEVWALHKAARDRVAEVGAPARIHSTTSRSAPCNETISRGTRLGRQGDLGREREGTEKKRGGGARGEHRRAASSTLSVSQWHCSPATVTRAGCSRLYTSGPGNWAVTRQIHERWMISRPRSGQAAYDRASHRGGYIAYPAGHCAAKSLGDGEGKRPAPPCDSSLPSLRTGTKSEQGSRRARSGL